MGFVDWACSRPQRLLLVLAAMVAPTIAVAGPAERQDPDMPDAIQQVVALDDRSAIVVGASATQLRQIMPDGAVVLVEHPEVGTIAHVAARGRELWVVGDRGILHRSAKGAWVLVAIPPRDLDAKRPPMVAPLADGEAVVVRTIGGGPGVAGAEAIHVRSPDVVATFSFPGMTLASATSGSDGVAWALVATLSYGDPENDRVRGYVRFAEGRWRLWTFDDEVEPLQGVTREPAAVGASLQQLVSDRRGGAYGIQRRPERLFHIDATGTIDELDVSLPPRDYETQTRVLITATSGELLAVDVADAPDHPVRILPTDRGGAIENVPLAPWYLGADPMLRPRLRPVSASAASGVLWLSTRPMVLANVDDEWTSYASPAVLDGIESRRRQERRERRTGALRAYGPAALTLALGLGGGTYATSELHDERVLVGGLEVLAGTAAGLLPWEIAHETAPWMHPPPSTPGGAINVVIFGLSSAVAPLTASLGTWGTGELLDGSQYRGRAFVGAYAGASAGLLLGLTVSWLLRDSSPTVRRMVNAFGMSAIGSGAAIGYQLLGEGP